MAGLRAEGANRAVGPAASFARDVRRSLRVWADDPRLPIASMAVAMVETALPAVGSATGQSALVILGGVATIALLGFRGVERIWYVAAERGAETSWHDIRTFTRLLWRRYLGLAIYGTVLLFVPVVAITELTDQGSLIQGTLRFMMLVVVDMALTFATVVLAFSDVRAGDAVRHSLTVTRDQWPTCLYYVIAAPLAIQLSFAILSPDSLYLPLRLAVLALAAALALICRGATAFFYTDRYLVAAVDGGVDDGDVDDHS